MSKEYSEENLDFWHSVQDFRTLAINAEQDKEAKEALPTRAREIADTFIKTHSPSAVNIDSATQNKILSSCKSLNNISVDLFNQAENEIIKLLTCDSYPRFKQSSAFEEWKKKHNAEVKIYVDYMHT